MLTQKARHGCRRRPHVATAAFNADNLHFIFLRRSHFSCVYVFPFLSPLPYSTQPTYSLSSPHKNTHTHTQTLLVVPYEATTITSSCPYLFPSYVGVTNKQAKPLLVLPSCTPRSAPRASSRGSHPTSVRFRCGNACTQQRPKFDSQGLQFQ